MNRTVATMGMLVMMSILALSVQGCGTRWLQSGGDKDGVTTLGGSPAGNAGASGSDSGDAVSQLPSLSQGGSTRELSGFSSNPAEERLAFAQHGTAASLSPSDARTRGRAELTKEEKAALEAGFQDIFFGYDQWMVSSAGMESLNRDASYLKDHPGAILKIEGHCDERGTGAYNLVLGDKRARAARAYLIEIGVSPKQVDIVSYGKERPFCFDRDESCYRLNRRGHMLLSVK